MNPRAKRAAAAFGAAVLLFTAACTDEGAGPSPSPSPPTGSVTTAAASPKLAWRRIASAPTERQEVAAAVVGSKIYVVGGLVGSGRATDVVEIYDPARDTWAAGPRLPIAVHHAMAAERNGSLVVMGGFVGDLGGAATDRVFVLAGDTWRDGPKLRRARGAGAAVTVDDEVVLVGGISEGGHVGPVEIFDGTRWRDGARIPSLRDHLGAATDGAFVYTVGGRRSGGHFATFERYELSADTWTRFAPMPTPRSGLGAAFVDGRVVAAGGEGPRMFPEVESFGIEAAVWSKLPPMLVPRHGVGVVAVGRTVYTLVGGVRVGSAPSAACEALEIPQS